MYKWLVLFACFLSKTKEQSTHSSCFHIAEQLWNRLWKYTCNTVSQLDFYLFTSLLSCSYLDIHVMYLIWTYLYLENTNFCGKLNKSTSDNAGRSVYSSGCDRVSVNERGSRVGKGANRKGGKGPELQLEVCLEPSIEKITQKERDNTGEQLFATAPGVAPCIVWFLFCSEKLGLVNKEDLSS